MCQHIDISSSALCVSSYLTEVSGEWAAWPTGRDHTHVQPWGRLSNSIRKGKVSHTAFVCKMGCVNTVNSYTTAKNCKLSSSSSSTLSSSNSSSTVAEVVVVSKSQMYSRGSTFSWYLLALFSGKDVNIHLCFVMNPDSLVLQKGGQIIPKLCHGSENCISKQLIFMELHSCR